MGRILFLVFSLPFLAHGTVTPFKIIATGGSPIPTAYSTSDTQSKVLTGLNAQHTICVFNDTASVVAINVDNGDKQEAPTSGLHDIYVPASVGACRAIPISSRVYLRSDSGAPIVAGTVYGDVE